MRWQKTNRAEPGRQVAGSIFENPDIDQAVNKYTK
jgi:hypothetical protein